MKIQDHVSVHPEDNNNISYWTRKWGVSPRQLNDAILDTGSINIAELRAYLKKRVYAPGFWQLLRTKFIH